MFPSSHQLQRESSFSDWKHPRGLLTWLWSDWIGYVVVQHFSRSVTISFLCFTTNSVLVLFLVLCEVSVHVYAHIRVQAKSSNGTTVRTFSNFNLLHGRCTFLPFLLLLHHYALLVWTCGYEVVLQWGATLWLWSWMQPCERMVGSGKQWTQPT